MLLIQVLEKAIGNRERGRGRETRDERRECSVDVFHYDYRFPNECVYKYDEKPQSDEIVSIELKPTLIAETLAIFFSTIDPVNDINFSKNECQYPTILPSRTPTFPMTTY